MDIRKYLSRTLLCAFSFLLIHQAHAVPTVEDYGALPSVGMMSIAPNGKLIAFRKHDGERDLLIVYSLAESKLARAIDISSIKPHTLYFLDDHRVVLKGSDNMRLFGYRGRHNMSTAFALDVRSGEIDQLLTPGDVIKKGQLGLGNIVGKSADGRYVYMPAFVGERETDQSPDYSLVRVDLESVRRPRVVEKGDEDTIDYFVDDNGNVLAEEIFSNHYNYHSIVAHHGDEEVEIYRYEDELADISIVGLTPDKKNLVVLNESEKTGRVSYYTMSLKDGKLSKPMFERTDADVEHVLTDINRVAHGVLYSGLTPSYEFFNSKLNERLEKIQADFPGQSVWISDWNDDWNDIVVKVEGSGISGEYFLYNAKGEARFLAAARPTITREHVHPVVSFTYKARDGLDIPALVTIPSAFAADPKNLPAVMLPHGGPEAHDWLGFDWLAQGLASRGYLVIQPQFRGSSGFGYAHRAAGHGEWGKKMQDDLTDAVELLVKQKLIDPQRICIVGASYGGYAALAGGAFTPDLYRCVVSINGVSDIDEMLDSEESDHGDDHWVVAYWNQVIANGEKDRDFLDVISPANFAEKFNAPVLLLHGDRDKVVPYDQSKLMYKQLKRANKAVELIKLKKEDHHLSSPETRLHALKATLDFVDQHIGEQQEL